MTWAPRVDRCAEHFERADRATEELARRTGLACPPGCGACCLSPLVETIDAEVRPLAAALVDEGRAPFVLARLDALAAAGDRRCALYEPEEKDPRRGRCGAFALRPLVCRLFGFAARRDRLGRPELIACSVMRAADPATVERAREDVRAGAAVPLLGDHVRAIAAEDPTGGARQVPINDALRSALERELLARRIAALAAEDPEPDRRRPRRRRRAA